MRQLNCPRPGPRERHNLGERQCELCKTREMNETASIPHEVHMQGKERKCARRQLTCTLIACRSSLASEQVEDSQQQVQEAQLLRSAWPARRQEGPWAEQERRASMRRLGAGGAGPRIDLLVRSVPGAGPLM